MTRSVFWSSRRQVKGRTMSRKVFLAAIPLLLLGWSGPVGAAISLIYPPPQTRVNDAEHLVVKLNNPEITGVRITLNGLASDLLNVGTPEYRKSFQDILIVKPVWDPGKNKLTIDGYAGDKQLETVSAEIYYIPKGSTQPAPPEVPAAVLHTPEQEKHCKRCHVMNPTPAQMNESLEKGNPCYTCHKNMLNDTYVHGPTGTFSCAFCHSLQGKPKYATPKRDAALCNECHVDKGTALKKWQFRHGPVDAGMCEICHDPHGSPYPGQLRQPVNKLCLSCHESVATGIHVNRTVSGEGHPLGGKKDPNPAAKGRELSCVSCHNPHGGDVRYFFINNAEDRLQLCQMCHKK